MASLKLKTAAQIVVSLFIGGAVSVGLYHTFFTAKSDTPPPLAQENKVLFWYDPMYPNTKFDQPGKSPFMDMDLVPKYADEGESGEKQKPGIRIDPTLTQNLGLKTEKARRGRLDYSLTVPANLSFNEYQYTVVQARAEGFIEKVYPLTVGDRVAKDEPLLEVTIPEWVEAQSEYLLLISTGAPRTQINGVLERLRLAGMPEEDIQRLKQSKKTQTRFQIRAPIGGVITAFDLRNGMNISKDKVIAQIQGVDPIWINAAIPESIAYLLKDASQFHVSIPAYPDRTFLARKWTILPSADASTRTLQVRVQIDNKDESLKPGMNAYLSLRAQSQEMLLIPSRAVIDSGGEQRVITLTEEGRFVPKRIAVFHESREQTAITAGLAENDTVVTSGLFLIDSEANISGALDRMRATDNASLPVEHTEHKGH